MDGLGGERERGQRKPTIWQNIVLPAPRDVGRRISISQALDGHGRSLLYLQMSPRGHVMDHRRNCRREEECSAVVAGQTGSGDSLTEDLHEMRYFDGLQGGNLAHVLAPVLWHCIRYLQVVAVDQTDTGIR